MKEVIDRKFKFLAVNPCKGTHYDETDGIVFLAKDKAVPQMLLSYHAECERLGCGEEHLESIELLYGRVIAFQSSVESKIPDTETDCEIRRCIGGEVKP